MHLTTERNVPMTANGLGRGEAMIWIEGGKTVFADQKKKDSPECISGESIVYPLFFCFRASRRSAASL